jgi:hypothetical protein
MLCVTIPDAHHQQQACICLTAVEFADVTAGDRIKAALFDATGDRVSLALE